MLLDISNCVPFVFHEGTKRSPLCFSVLLLFKKRARNGPELRERRGYVSNHLHDWCCAMSLWEMLCVSLRVNGCIPVPKKLTKKVQGQSQHGLFSGRSINCSSNLQIIILLYTCINRCLVSAGENVPLSLARFVHFGQLTFTSNNREKGFYLWLVKQIKRVAFITCFYVRQYRILFADMFFVYYKVMCKKMHLCEILDTFF